MESHESQAPNGKRGGDHGGQTFGERIDRVSGSAQQAWSRTRDAIGDIKGTLDIDGRVGRHPYGTIAAAVGIGYVLGGGLFSRLSARILGLGLRVGLRLAALPLIKDELMGLAETLGEGESGTRGRTRQRNTNKNTDKEQP